MYFSLNVTRMLHECYTNVSRGTKTNREDLGTSTVADVHPPVWFPPMIFRMILAFCGETFTMRAQRRCQQTLQRRLQKEFVLLVHQQQTLNRYYGSTAYGVCPSYVQWRSTRRRRWYKRHDGVPS